MQMIWLLGAVAPAKKVHFNLNGSELRGFPIKARSGQSSILYANPLAPKAVARFCLCLAVITGANVPVVPVCQNFLTHIYSCYTYSRLTHTYSQSHTHRPLVPSHLIRPLNVSFHFSKGLVTCKWGTNRSAFVLNAAYSGRAFGHTHTQQLLFISDSCVQSINDVKKPKVLYIIAVRTNSISSIKCPLNWIWTCQPI